MSNFWTNVVQSAIIFGLIMLLDLVSVLIARVSYGGNIGCCFKGFLFLLTSTHTTYGKDFFIDMEYIIMKLINMHECVRDEIL